MPGTEEAIKAAAGRGWEAVVVVIVLIVFVGMMVMGGKWLIASLDSRLKEAYEREQALTMRINELEKYLRESLTQLIGKMESALSHNAEVIAKVEQAIHDNATALLDVRSWLKNQTKGEER